MDDWEWRDSPPILIHPIHSRPLLEYETNQVDHIITPGTPSVCMAHWEQILKALQNEQRRRLLSLLEHNPKTTPWNSPRSGSKRGKHVQGVNPS